MEIRGNCNLIYAQNTKENTNTKGGTIAAGQIDLLRTAKREK